MKQISDLRCEGEGMADVIQAAKWMKEGKTVRRKSWHTLLAKSIKDGDMDIIVEDNDEATVTDVALTVNALLADDWEIAHG